ncbi:Holliday junction resolvase RuvX [Prochlorococcus marinus]|uniref:Putative pre-16S rRNA nuclease n=1 Tax=Prochlorococcus marinus XMU1408 TaxID=2213228 RepID=A0A318R537_PROMR|nr:Holliday junction resolvase RuvX [Prochlorococcus marinus]MBW3041795.1 Holliday junction resolvase RuvX [Prochlorococcus marinus str. XMU1408]PYE02938.1 Holliday junction resolvase RuvX [Prochlorococcus marinus XMU1408]
MIQPKPCSVLSLDIGNKRIGIAGCDPLGISITHLPAIFKKGFEEDLQKFKNICASRKVEGLVIGNPLDMYGKETNQSIRCKKYGIKLAKCLNLPLVFINEHCSTVEAKEKFSLKSDKSGKIDSAAAAILLQQWLIEGPDLDDSN